MIFSLKVQCWGGGGERLSIHMSVQEARRVALVRLISSLRASFKTSYSSGLDASNRSVIILISLYVDGGLLI